MAKQLALVTIFDILVFFADQGLQTLFGRQFSGDVSHDFGRSLAKIG